MLFFVDLITYDDSAINKMASDAFRKIYKDVLFGYIYFSNYFFILPVRNALTEVFVL